MRDIYADYLFSQGYLVAEARAQEAGQANNPIEALVALANFARIRVTSRPELADLSMLQVAQRVLGINVPPAFYRGFPRSVRKLHTFQLALDQLVHYATTYGFGDFSTPGHSFLEEYIERVPFAENVEPKLMAILTEEEAQGVLRRAADGFLASSRPLSDASYELLIAFVREYAHPVRSCACKDTACRLLIDTRDVAYADLLDLPDAIRLVEWLLEKDYENGRISKLNLKNQDRKLIVTVLDRLLARDGLEIGACLEKKRLWCGLLHHLHYQPSSAEGQAFCCTMRDRSTRSAYAAFQKLLQTGDACGAADTLLRAKGPGAVLRQLDCLLSRCTSEEDVRYVLGSLKTDNKVVLIQLLMHYHDYEATAKRVFRFVRMGRMRKHAETAAEARGRRSVLDETVAALASMRVRELLAHACRGSLGRVYADEQLRDIALPLQEAASMGGFGTLPRGTRLPLPQGKKVRAFVWWQEVDDIDLSCIGLTDTGQAREFSWRTMVDQQSDAIAYSGDQTSGFHGGSEFFDIDVNVLRSLYPDIASLVLCANVFTRGKTFAQCVCRAGYMLRDTFDTGEVFEPKSVQSAFTINCDSHAAYLFMLDLRKDAFVWLNVAEESDEQVAGEADLTFLLDYLHVANALSLYDFAHMLAGEVVDCVEAADVVFSDQELALRDDQEQIRSRDTARILELLN